MRAIRALYEIFLKNREIENIDEYLKNDPPPIVATTKTNSKLPALKDPVSSLRRRKTYQQAMEVPSS